MQKAARTKLVFANQNLIAGRKKQIKECESGILLNVRNIKQGAEMKITDNEIRITELNVLNI
jgi:hypothetical protein